MRRQEILEGRKPVGSELSSDNGLNTYQGRLSNEIVLIQDNLGELASLECELKDTVDKLTTRKEDLVRGIRGLESVIKQAITVAVEEAEREREINEHLQKEKAELESQLKEKEKLLQTQAATIEELEEKLKAKSDDLERQTLEKATLLEVRDAVLANLTTTRAALNILEEDLQSLTGEEIILHELSQQDEGESGISKLRQMKDLEEHMAAELEILRAGIRERDVMLGAKEMEIEMIKQSLETKIEELEGLLKQQARKGKRASVVSYLVDFGKKHHT